MEHKELNLSNKKQQYEISFGPATERQADFQNIMKIIAEEEKKKRRRKKGEEKRTLTRRGSPVYCKPFPI